VSLLMKQRALVILAFLLTALALIGCTDRYKMLGPSFGKTPPCGSSTYVVSHRGDFNSSQIQDLYSVLGEIGLWSNRQIFYVGEVDWNYGSPQQLEGTIILERYDGVPHPGYALPGKFVKLGPWLSSWRSPSEPSYESGPTFRGALAHEMMHALTGAADMYNEPGGNPGLIMGTGYYKFNKLALGDIKAAPAGGCW